MVKVDRSSEKNAMKLGFKNESRLLCKLDILSPL